MRYLSFLLLSLSLLLGSATAFSQDASSQEAPAAGEIAVPMLKSRVTDLTGTLGAAEQQALEQKLAAFEQRKGSQLAVLIVASTGNEAIEQFGIRVAEQWKLGRKGTDDGLLLIVAKADRTLRIEVGYGLEGVIPDAIAKRVISEIIVPKFKTGDFAGGIDAGMTQLMALVDGEPLPPPLRQEQRQKQGQGGDNPLGMLLMAAMVGGQVLRSLLGPVVAGGVVGAGVFGVAWLITGTLGMALLLGLGGFFVTLLGIMGMIGSSGLGGGGRGGFGGMGGGGFGGGGGGFGGGGASGRW